LQWLQAGSVEAWQPKAKWHLALCRVHGGAQIQGAIRMSRQQEAVKHVLTSDGYRTEFGPWLNANWEIYEEFERMAVASQKRGRYRLSARHLTDMIRWNTALSEDRAPYKINNNHYSCMSRLAVKLNPSLEGMFEFRARVAA